MADEIRQTPIPVPLVYGQPAPPTPSQQFADTTTTTTAPATATATPSAPATGEQQPSSTTNPARTVEQSTMSDNNTFTMGNAAPSTEQAPSPAPAVQAPTSSNAPSPSPAANMPGRTGTPLRTNGQENNSSRAASQHPDAGFTMPAEAPPHGAPVRQYLNSKVTGPLLDGMKMLAKEQPKDPLRALGEYLLQRSKELESSST
ncbi:hypothetical protein GGS26DRAFT_539026 [Hypomontagnella submonticulosa]|nr:hypothetical protein GGS26DRAFT_539026 [Hypomontagnella submonticulosa]